MALPVTVGRTRIPGIKIHDTRMIRLMEVLLHVGTQLAGCRTIDIHTALLATFGLTRDAYSLTQLRYDLRKMKAHGFVEREGRRYCYRLTNKGIRVATMFVLFHKRVCGPLVNTLFQGPPDKSSALHTPIETAYYKADAAIQKLVDLLAA